jgi:hypothetical protein
MTDPIDAAFALIENPASVPDPEAELDRLRALAAPEDRYQFAMLAEGLALAMAGGIGAPDV